MTDRVLTLKSFFEDARAGRLTGIRCTACGTLAVPPREFCAVCQHRGWESVPLSGTGKIVSFTVIRIPPRGRAAEAPYAVAVVRLDEGVSMLGRLVEMPLDTLKTGLPVKFRTLVAEGETAIAFGPA